MERRQLVHRGTAGDSPVRHVVNASRDGRVLVFGEEGEDLAAGVFVELDDVECLRIVERHAQHRLVPRDDDAVNHHIRALHCLGQEQSPAICIFEIQRHLELFGLVATAEEKQNGAYYRAVEKELFHVF